MTGEIDVPSTTEFVTDFQHDFPEGSPSAEAMKKRKVAKDQYDAEIEKAKNGEKVDDVALTKARNTINSRP
ncbi:MAG: hypothetical protein CSA50_02250 [Gammaproteobacteria bacterium]|nr:MAG: hypothetical protein CSA50_02250 [Gammaproteobacteria bacterium]